ncbi:kinase-like domain-containing protein [Amylostereum chailletii]|nr:kinase-like domain-containing protein [Amylostereum chailletii]
MATSRMNMDSLTLSDIKSLLSTATALNDDPDRVYKWVYMPDLVAFGRHVLEAELDGIPLIIKYRDRVLPVEAETMQYVSRHTNIRVPHVYAVFSERGMCYIVEERLPGSTLQDALPGLDADARATIGRELKEIITSLSQLSSHRTILGPLHGPWKDVYFYRFLHDYPIGSDDLRTTRSFLEYFINIKGYYPYYPASDGPTVEERLRPFDCSRPPVFTHGDLVPCNVMIDNGHVVGIVDWAEAGWYPYFWNHYMLEKQGYARWKGVELWQKMISESALCEPCPNQVRTFKTMYSWASYLY